MPPSALCDPTGGEGTGLPATRQLSAQTRASEVSKSVVSRWPVLNALTAKVGHRAARVFNDLAPAAAGLVAGPSAKPSRRPVDLGCLVLPMTDPLRLTDPLRWAAGAKTRPLKPPSVEHEPPASGPLAIAPDTSRLIDVKKSGHIASAHLCSVVERVSIGRRPASRSAPMARARRHLCRTRAFSRASSAGRTSDDATGRAAPSRA